MSKYIKLNDALQYALRDSFTDKQITGRRKVTDIRRHLLEAPTIDIVHCKDCVHYDPPHINDNGKRIEYSDLSTDLPQEDFCVAGHIVSAKYGVNVGGRCTVDYNNGYSEDKRVYRKETDFCSKGEREEK